MKKLFMSHDAKARQAKQEALDRTTVAEAALEARKVRSFDPGDIDSVRSYKPDIAALEDALDIERGVLAHWTTVVAKFDAEAAERAMELAHAEEEKRAKADEALVRKADRQITELTETLQLIEASRARTDEANKVRGTKPFIEDCEFRVRNIPGKLLPQITQKTTLWVDEDDQPVKEQVYDASYMKYVRNPRAVRKVTRDEVLRTELQLPPEMPSRFADTIQLVDLKGAVIWPPYNGYQVL